MIEINQVSQKIFFNNLKQIVIRVSIDFLSFVIAQVSLQEVVLLMRILRGWRRVFYFIFLFCFFFALKFFLSLFI